jgi:hypothetical protein
VVVTVPESVRKIADDAARDHLLDIEAAVAQVERNVRELPNFDQIVTNLLKVAIHDLVYDARHKFNVQMKRDTGRYGGPPTVRVGESDGVGRAFASVYDYCIAGTVLGDIIGSRIDELAEHEDNLANGHKFNAAVLRWLKSKGVKGDKRVREVVSEGQLRNAFDRIQKEVKG